MSNKNNVSLATMTHSVFVTWIIKSLFCGTLVYYIWNKLIVEDFALPHLSYLTAIAIVFLWIIATDALIVNVRNINTGIKRLEHTLIHIEILTKMGLFSKMPEQKEPQILNESSVDNP
jgi:hypothetical protein